MFVARRNECATELLSCRDGSLRCKIQQHLKVSGIQRRHIIRENYMYLKIKQRAAQLLFKINSERAFQEGSVRLVPSKHKYSNALSFGI